MKVCLLILGFAFICPLVGQNTEEPNLQGRALIFEGNEAYLNDDFKAAEDLYRKKINENPDDISKFNLGNSLYKQGRFDESSTSFQEALSGLSDKQKSSAYYNLGNSMVKEEKLKEAIESYRQAIQSDVDNYEARENMVKTKMLLRQQEQQQQEQQQNQDNQEQQEQQDDQQDQQDPQQDPQQNQEEQQEEQSSQSQEEDQNQEEETEDQQSQEEPLPQELTKEEAERLLQAIENEEKDIMEKIRKQNGNQVQPKKDW